MDNEFTKRSKVLDKIASMSDVVKLIKDGEANLAADINLFEDFDNLTNDILAVEKVIEASYDELDKLYQSKNSFEFQRQAVINELKSLLKPKYE